MRHADLVLVNGDMAEPPSAKKIKLDESPREEMKRLTEKSVGIIHYLNTQCSNQSTVNGVIKQRFEYCY